MHGPPGHRCRRNHRYHHQLDKITRKECNDISNSSSHYLADSYFFCPLLGGKSGQAQQPETGNDDGNDGEDQDKGRSPGVCLV